MPLSAHAQEISRITIHHQGEIWDPAAPVPSKLVRLQNQFQVGSDKIATHLDYSSQTVCPGRAFVCKTGRARGQR